MSVAAPLQMGDRVELSCAIQGMAAGTRGTIVHYFIASALYDVHFDGYHQLRVISYAYLVHVLPARQRDGRGDEIANR